MVSIPGMNIAEDSGSSENGLHWDNVARDYYQLTVGAKPRTVKARREVILAAGTIHTPQIPQLSGIGPNAALKNVGIEVKVDLPGGGGTQVVKQGQDPASHLPSSYTPKQIEGYRQQQAVYARLLRAPDTTVNSMMMNGPGDSIQSLHTFSRGVVTLNPAEPQGDVIVDYRAATNEIDLEIMVENIRFMRRYMASEVFKPYSPQELSPGTSVQTTEQLISWARNQIISSIYHPVGSYAKVPREHGGCVDEQLLVYDARNLSVIDAKKAADLIKERTFD
ncbi:hypothetical protein DL767_002698 [Monosporascus sp. MG133]|nr:hypothetical protein DL767_002698 [Monosporascus sp. MG133]